MSDTCGECKFYHGGKNGFCLIDKRDTLVCSWEDACSDFERRIDMDKTITISQDRFEYFLRVEARYELAQSIYRSFDRYTSDDVLGPILGPRELPKEDKCETI